MKIEKQRAILFNSVYGVDTLPKVLNVFTKDYRSIKNIEGTKSESLQLSINLFQRYLLAITYMYSTSSIKNNLKQFKAIIKKEKGEFPEIAEKVFHIGGGKDEAIPSIHKIVSAKTDENIAKKESTKTATVFDVQKEILSIKKILSDRTYSIAKNQTEPQVRAYYISYLLGLTGGRRIAEILLTSSIKKSGDTYIFDGILKKEKNDKTVVEANLLYLSIKDYRAYQKELRAFISSKLKDKKLTLKTVKIGQINTIFSKVFNNAIRRISDDRVPNFHELRHHYTIEGTKMFKREGESDIDTRYRILGHKVKSDTTRTYATTK